MSHIDSIDTNTPFKSFLQKTAYTRAQNESYYTNTLNVFIDKSEVRLSSRIVNCSVGPECLSVCRNKTSVIDFKVLTEITIYSRKNTVSDAVVYNTC